MVSCGPDYAQTDSVGWSDYFRVPWIYYTQTPVAWDV